MTPEPRQSPASIFAAVPRLTKALLIVGCLAVIAVVYILSTTPWSTSSESNKQTKKSPAGTKQAQQKPLEQRSTFTFPGGKSTLVNNYRFVALYGAPDTPVLGALGKQPLEEALARAVRQAAAYQPYSAQTIYPTLEIIATIAAGEPTDNGDYSRELSIDKLTPWVQRAQAQGVYVILDLQPGRSDFLTQAKLYEPLLKEPNVGLALDPEWRLAPDQIHLKQTGSVSSQEVNQTSNWLADLCKTNQLPQKLFLIHQFKLKMLPDRVNLDTTRPELMYAIQMDGQGAQNVKQDTWRLMTENLPKNTVMGWKNFTVKDTPMLTEQQTMQVEPQPWYISYQ